MSHVSHGEQLTMAKSSGSKQRLEAATEHKEKHDKVAQEFINIASLQRLVTKKTRESLKKDRPEEKLTPEARSAQLVLRADQDQGQALGSPLLTVTAETLTGLLTSHDPAYTAHSMLAAAASLLFHFHAKFFSFYDQLLALIVTLTEETKTTAVATSTRGSFRSSRRLMKDMQLST